MNALIRLPEVSDFINECCRIDPKILVFDDGSYQPCEGGFPALQIPVDDRFGVPYDIVAYAVDDPVVWWMRCGLATVLGEHALFVAEWRGQAVNLYPTPAAWLHSRDYAGVCVLDWTANLRLVLGRVPEVRCLSRTLANELAQRLQEQVKPRFAITVRGERHAA
ncbi:MAG: hypothetical protein O6944_04165 [Gammaproteobacteria bacterium]|nr:hypothetical protein [Gammaproteobacteria bacterium]